MYVGDFVIACMLKLDTDVLNEYTNSACDPYTHPLLLGKQCPGVHVYCQHGVQVA